MSTTPRTRWGILGLGRAGRARSRAITTDPRCTLQAVHRGRFLAEIPASLHAATVDEVLEQCDAVAIAAPDATHPELVRRTLEAGCHVVCEYPLAPDPATASALFALAERQQRCLHVSHIELLHSPQQGLRAGLAEDPAARIEQTFHRRSTPWLGPDWGHGQVARLHRLVDLGGPLAELEQLAWTPERVQGRLIHCTGAVSCIDWTQGPDRPRSTHQRVHTRLGRVWDMQGSSLTCDNTAVALTNDAPLFARDHAVAMSRIVTGRPGYLTNEQVLHVLSWVPLLEAAAGPKSSDADHRPPSD